MKEVSIYIVTGIKGRWQQDGHIRICAGILQRIQQVPGGD